MNEPSQPSESKWSGHLSDLSDVALDDHYLEIAARAGRGNAGSPAWRHRKEAELRDVLALAQVSGRMSIMLADLTVALRLMFELRCVVPTLPDPAGDLVLEERALIGLTYQEQAIREPLPGFAFVTLLRPKGVWLPNAGPPDPSFRGPGPGQPLCLGARVAAGTPVKELILQTFGALTMQSVQLDARDAAGLMNGDAADWWLRSETPYPLSREGFLEYSPDPEP